MQSDGWFNFTLIWMEKGARDLNKIEALGVLLVLTVKYLRGRCEVRKKQDQTTFPLHWMNCNFTNRREGSPAVRFERFGMDDTSQ